MPVANESLNPALPGPSPAPVQPVHPRASGLHGALVPLAAVVIVVAITAALGRVVALERAVVPEPRFEALVIPGYPDRLSMKESAAVAEAGMWWLSLTVLLWVVAVVAIGWCVWHLYRATSHDAGYRRRVLGAFGAIVTVVAAVLAVQAAGAGKSFVPFIPMVRNLALIADGFVSMANLNGMLGYLAGVVFVLANCAMLLPAAHDGMPVAQMRAITSMMVVSALFLAVWIATAAALYRLCAALLVEDARVAAVALAPTISLMGGLFLSLLLAAGYLASAAWLQHRHARYVHDGVLPAEVRSSGPIALLKENWPKVAGILVPLVPGAASAVLQALSKGPAAG
jgi:hypothetical protein